MTNLADTIEEPADGADAELEQLLTEALDAPAIPRTLLRRLDLAIEQEWGTSPRLAHSAAAGVSRRLVSGARWARSLPLAAALGIMMVAAVLFRADSTAFAWAQLVEALAGQQVVEVESGSVRRWVALSDGLISEQSGGVSCLLDVNQQVVLHRDRGTSHIRRQVLTSKLTDDPEHLLLAVLGQTALGRTVLPDGSVDGLAETRILHEESKFVTSDGQRQIQLDVQFQYGDAGQVSLRAVVDPETHLPVSLQIQADAVPARFMTVTYPSGSARERRLAEFPTDMPVIDVSSSADIRTAMHDSSKSEIEPAGAAESLVASDNAAPVRLDVAAAELMTPPLFGAASKWKPVSVVERSGGEVVRQLNLILAELWQQNGVEPAAPATDETLLRRIYLDLAGRTPTVTEVRRFLQNGSPERYEHLVDQLLNSPDHATHLATMYRTFLIPEGVDLAAFGGVEAFDQWLSDQFARNNSYDEIVRRLLLAEGRLSRSGPLLFYSAAKLDPDQLASRTSRVFLGMRLECAQCHDHPFEPWTQQDFWSYAAFFARISRPQGKLENVSTVMQVRDVERGEVMIPDTDTVVPPRFLNSVEPLAEEQADRRRQALATWLTSARNPYFSRAAANRVWGQMFGRGLVDPVDDFGVENPPVSPEALDLLAGHFINSGFQLKELFRTTALSRAYRLSSGADTVDHDRVSLFAQMNVKTLTAEQVYDCITVATMPSGAGATGFNVDRFANTPRSEFLAQFRTPAGRPTEYLGGIPQALTLMNGTLIDGATGLSSSGLLKSLEAPFFTNEQRIEVLYFATLSRQPTAAEWELLNEFIGETTSGVELRENLADILWALLNSAEFAMNH
ncbi:MAG: DUF1549 and DUF1553 domain-containing protein [Fuerstiella sp.]